MPNNCNWHITMSKLSKKDYDYILSEFRNNDKNLAEIAIPMPDNIYRGSLWPEERERYWKNNWYDWCCENWGTKWWDCDTFLDRSVEYEDNTCELEFTFWTARTPMAPVVQKLSEKFKCNISYCFDEPWMGFSWEREYEQGEETYCADYDDAYFWETDTCDICKWKFHFESEEWYINTEKEHICEYCREKYQISKIKEWTYVFIK